VVAGAKVEAMTIMDFLLKPELVTQAWDYYRDVQQMDTEYKPMISEDEKPATYLNAEIQDTFRPELEKYYYDETRYDSYLEQLGIKYPTVKEQ
jgi:aminobenzoyl-glutamate utilization protein B